MGRATALIATTPQEEEVRSTVAKTPAPTRKSAPPVSNRERPDEPTRFAL